MRSCTGRAMLLGCLAGVSIMSLACTGEGTGEGSSSTGMGHGSPRAATTAASEGSPAPTPKLPTAISAAGARMIPLKELQTARLALDSPDWLAATPGALWVKLDPGTVLQLDPATAGVRTRIAAHGPDAFNLCQGFGQTGDAVWSCTPFGTIERIEATSGRVTDRLRYQMRSDQGHLVEASNRLWLIPRSGDALAGIDLSDRTLGPPIQLGAACAELAAADPIIWAVCPGDNQVVRVDTAAGRVTGRLALPQPRQVAVGEDVWVGFQDGVAQLDPESLAVEAVYDVDPGLGGSLWAGEHLVWVRGDQNTFLTALDPAAHRVVYQITAADLPSGGEVLGVGHQLWATAFDDATLVRLHPPAG